MKKIALHSVPRSGSTWLGEILNSHPGVLYKFQPLFSYALKGYLSPESKLEDIHDFFAKLTTTKDDFLDQVEQRSLGKLPQFDKHTNAKAIVYKEVRYHHILENLLKTDKDVIVIGLIRNPKSVINSWYHAPREFRKDLDWDIDQEWKFAPSKNLNKPEEFNGFEKWKEVAQLFLELEKQYPKRFLLVNYTDLLASPIEEAKKIFSFCGLSFEEQTSNFINSKQNENKPLDAYSVYRSKQSDNKWVTALPKSICEQIDTELEGTNLQQFVK